MENSFLVALSQQMAVNRALEVIANNIANLSTPAFKRESVQFEEYVVPVAATEAEGGGMIDVSFVLDRGVARDISNGRFEPTGNMFDLAISGAGYFVIDTPDGERYTRSGHFTLNDQGQVVTEEGHPLLSEAGPITLSPQDGDLHVAADGSLSTRLQALGKLRIVSFADEQALRKTGASLYDAGGQAPEPAPGARVRQGMVETSNVEPVVEITRMIEILRAYQASAELTRSGEELLRQAIEKLGAVPSV